MGTGIETRPGGRTAGGAAGMLGLLQLADSCFPAGGFAFSNGLESLAKGGWLRGLEDFRQYLESYLVQVASAELPFLNSAFPLASQAGPETPSPLASQAGPETPSPLASQAGPETPSPLASQAGPGGPDTPPALPEYGFAEVAWEWDAFLTLPAPRRASLSLGQAWLRAMEGAYGGDGGTGMAALRPWFLERELPAHFLMAFAAGLRAAGFRLEEAQSLLMHLALRDQLGAAVRLGLVGSLQAQSLHRRFLPAAEALRVKHGGSTHLRSMKMAPMIEMGQAGHPYLYSRLFQS